MYITLFNCGLGSDKANIFRSPVQKKNDSNLQNLIFRALVSQSSWKIAIAQADLNSLFIQWISNCCRNNTYCHAFYYFVTFDFYSHFKPLGNIYPFTFLLILDHTSFYLPDRSAAYDVLLLLRTRTYDYAFICSSLSTYRLDLDLHECDRTITYTY